MNAVLAPSERDDGFPAPRQFQIDAHNALRKGFKEGHKNQLIMAPTGAGKTYLGLRVCYEAMQRGKKAVFLCDRTTLIDQTSAVADRYGLQDHGVIQAQHWRRRPDELLQIASVQTVAKRQFWPQMDVLVVDEAHTTYKAWTNFAKETGAAVIGLSATPFTPSLGKIFTNLVNATTMHDLTQLGVLTPMRIFSCRKPDMTGAETQGKLGEWTDKAAEEREMAIVGDVVNDWLTYGENRKTIVFGATIKHCQELARQFIANGVMAAVFTSETTAKEREELLKEYRTPDSMLKVLISVEALAKGFDVPDVGCICDARPLRKSLSTAIQMWGRGLRSSPGKKDCHLLDFSGNIIRFFDDFNDIYFNGLDALNDGEKLDKKVRTKEEFEKKGCPRCGYTPFHKRCMACGFEKQSTTITEVKPGDMREIYMGEGKNKKKMADNAEHLWNQCCSYARIHSKPESQQGRSYHLFKKITGQDPIWKFSTAPQVEILNAVYNKIQQMNMAYKAATKGLR